MSERRNMDGKLANKQTKTYYFHTEWEEEYFFVYSNSKSICLICNSSVALPKKCNLERHFKTMHKRFETDFPLKSSLRTQKVRELKNKLAAQQSVFTRPSTKVLTSAAMTELEKSMESMIVVFHRYAKESGNKTTLSKKELKKLIENELPSFLKSQKSPDTVERIIKDLDENKDDELDFEEFVPFVAGITIACEKHFALCQEQKGKK